MSAKSFAIITVLIVAINTGFAFGCTKKVLFGLGSVQFNCPDDGDYSKVFCCGPSDDQYCCNFNTGAENVANSVVDTVKNAAENAGKVIQDGMSSNCICNGDYNSDCCQREQVLSTTIIIIIIVASAVVLLIIITIICCCCCKCCCAKKEQQGLVFIQPRAPDNVQVFIPSSQSYMAPPNQNAPQDSYSLNQVAGYPGNSSDFGNGYPGAPQNEFPAVAGVKYDRKPLLNNPI